MKTTTWIIIILASLAAIMIAMNKQIKKALSRGYRNNNPGNIRITRDSKGNKTYWQGEVDGNDKDFKTFKTMVDGYRAMFVTLRSYLGKDINTIEKIISRYAPATENATEAYIKAVAANTGIDKDDKISIAESDKLRKLVAAISYHENGVAANLQHVSEGYNLFILS